MSSINAHSEEYSMIVGGFVFCVFKMSPCRSNLKCNDRSVVEDVTIFQILRTSKAISELHKIINAIKLISLFGTFYFEQS